MENIVESSSSLNNYAQFRNLFNLRGIDVLDTRLWFDRKIADDLSDRTSSPISTHRHLFIFVLVVARYAGIHAIGKG